MIPPVTTELVMSVAPVPKHTELLIWTDSSAGSQLQGGSDTVQEERCSMETVCDWFVSRVQVVLQRLDVVTHLVSSEVASVECTNTPCVFIATTFN